MHINFFSYFDLYYTLLNLFAFRACSFLIHVDFFFFTNFLVKKGENFSSIRPSNPVVVIDLLAKFCNLCARIVDYLDNWRGHTVIKSS